MTEAERRNLNVITEVCEAFSRHDAEAIPDMAWAIHSRWVSGDRRALRGPGTGRSGMPLNV